jgi:POT family proton-dependent oligopeptide transporter
MYFFHTTGELCLSPVGLSMVTKLSVQRVAAMMMGVWFLSSAFASYAGGIIAGAMAIEESAGETIDAATSLLVYTTVFEKLAIVAMVLGVFMLLISPLLHKRMHGVH